MAEKYKIYVPEEMKTRLMNDAELFDFTKKDGSINLNLFLKDLLVCYFDLYRTRKKELLETILSDLFTFRSISKKDAAEIADRIVNNYMKNAEAKSSRSASITLTVSGRSADVMQAIENNMLKDSSLSQYLNDLFSSYLSIPRNLREKIIFSEAVDALDQAIKNHDVITFSSTSAPAIVFTVRPYMIAASKEEQCNYLLCADNETGLARSFRISRLRAVYRTGLTFAPDKAMQLKLQQIAVRNPQAATKNVDAKVRLTDRGMQKFSLVLKNRPEAVKKEGSTYYFHCPKFQLEEYFRRFGKEAVILEPEECRESMKQFYEKALKAYK